MTPKSFRLTKEAAKTLRELSDTFDISESKIINILLTEPSVVNNQATDECAAKRIIKLYFINKAK